MARPSTLAQFAIVAAALLPVIASLAPRRWLSRRRIAALLPLIPLTAELTVVVLAGWTAARSATRDVALLALVVAASASLWYRWVCRQGDGRVSTLLRGALGLIGLAYALLAGRAGPRTWQLTQTALADVLGSVAAGGLVAGALAPLGAPAAGSLRLYRRHLAPALVLQLGTVALYAWGAQRRWGMPWAWDPIECQLAAAVLSTAIAALVVCELPWRSAAKRMFAAWAAVAAVIVALAGQQMVRWLPILSRYLLP